MPAANQKTSQQNRHIFYLASQLGWDKELLDQYVFEWTKKRISGLTFNQAAEVIRNLKLVLKKTRPAAGRVVENRPGKMSGGQRNKILAVMTALGWNKNQVNGMCLQVAKVDHWEWLDGKGAYKLIEAMRSIYKRDHGHYPEQKANSNG